ncbi:hypothetical protein IQ254_29040 [Nodosilinea sp. LEGE 07088]|uniref:hypothetical protein n=1 Tax=Nodosilinea sp. LEGE 07088 TaxID=2777968 RepID=UPI00187EB33C|nr:hypothetical protein [Nodosilinea sp. LEGE 07088]MBE9141200.1 hypothetical protein [Nodosilinea sp. LEGE 07088]
MAPTVAPRPRRSRLASVGVVVIAAALAMGGCRPSAPPQVDDAPNSAVPAAPSQAESIPESALAALPQRFVAEWQPLSDVLLVFGPMTVTADEISWGSGQSSPYALIGTEGGYLLQLEASPSFYDTQTPYIKLIPKAASDLSDSIEVAFYTDASQLPGDDYVMYGAYFVEE